MIPRGCVPIETGYPGLTPTCIMEDEETGAGQVVGWAEPIPGNATPWNGFDLRDVREMTVGIDDHVGWMAEVHSCDGVEWTIARVVHSQPYGPLDRVDRLREYTTPLLDLNIHLHVVEEPHLSWYAPRESTLCIMQHTTPMPFDMFRRTFRYWLILNVLVPPHRNKWFHEWRLRDGLLPATHPLPDFTFFDILFCADETSVRFGLDDTGDAVYSKSEFPSDLIPRETFNCLWDMYRFWVSWRPLLRVCRFIARLKVMVKDRRDYTPPHGIKFLMMQRDPFL